VRQQQGISAQQRFENLDKFAVAHSLARVVIFHNGRMDYAHKILNTLRLPQLEVALSGCYHARHRGTEAVELEPKPALGAQSTYQTRYLPWLNKG
jgi:hypothetical protein